MASASLKPGAAALRTGGLGSALAASSFLSLVAVMTLPSQNSMLASCCPLYQIARIEDSCGKLQTKNRIQKERMRAHRSTRSPGHVSEYKSQQVASFSSQPAVISVREYDANSTANARSAPQSVLDVYLFYGYLHSQARTGAPCYENVDHRHCGILVVRSCRNAYGVSIVVNP